MARLVNAVVIAGLFTLAAAGTALGFGGHGARVTAQYPVYVAPVPVARVLYGVPVRPVYLESPCPEAALLAVPAISPFATPTPAPPSQTPEPPTAPGRKQAPKITESHALSSPSPANTPRAANSSPKGLHRVGFWNLSDRDVTVKVDGQPLLLARGRGVTMSLGRQFVWQIDQRELTKERIPEDKTTLEIVIRR